MTSLCPQIFEYVKKKYGTEPEYLWMRYPDYAVFRHEDNRKWYGIIMDVEREKLGLGGAEWPGAPEEVFESLDLSGSDKVDILNVKVDDLILAQILVQQEGYLRGYHQASRSWVSILLDGTVPLEEITGLIDMSYRVTASSAKKQKIRPPKEWVVPANPKYYDIQGAFEKAEEIDWKQGSGIRTGDTVFMYVAAPVSAILYKCRVTQTDIPFEFSNKNVTMKALMKIKLERRYEPEAFTFERLKEEYSIFAVRGPRGIPKSLSEALKG